MNLGISQFVCDTLYAQEHIPDVNKIVVNGVKFHRQILLKIAFFEELLKFHENDIVLDMSNQCLTLFKKWLYNQPIHFKEVDTAYEPEGVSSYQPNISVLNLSIIREIKNISMKLNVWFYNNLSKEIIAYINSSDIETKMEFCKEFGCDKNLIITADEFKQLDSRSVLYACCLFDGNGCDRDQKKAFELFKRGWEENKHIGSLSYYAACLRNGYGCMVDQKKAFELLKLNWEDNKDSGSLNNYAVYLLDGIGCEKDEKKALQLFKLGWEGNKDSSCLYSYAMCLKNGYGCNKDQKKAFELFKYNWNVNKHVKSLETYIYCLRNEIGCMQDKARANELQIILDGLPDKE